MKIIMFPFAGGSSYSFNAFKDKIPSEITIRVIDYYGRGNKSKLTFSSNIHELIQLIVFEIYEDIKNIPYIIYGHSLGGLIGYLVCQKLQEKKISMPQKLVVSGRKAPNISKKRKIGHLPDDQFWKEIVSIGGIPSKMINNREFITYFIPILKQDFMLSEGYVNQKSKKLNNIPIDVFYGSEEDITEEEINVWQEETTGKVTITKLKGNHFFIFDHKDFFTEYFKNLHLNATF